MFRLYLATYKLVSANWRKLQISQNTGYTNVSIRRLNHPGQLQYVIFNGIFGLIRAFLVTEDQMNR